MGVTASPKKREYVPDAKDVQTVKKIKLNEIELRDRTTVLRGIKSNVNPIAL
jgi:parafibromin